MMLFETILGIIGWTIAMIINLAVVVGIGALIWTHKKDRIKQIITREWTK